jgi:thiamine-phosphate pyrophosphorylase
LSSGTEPRILCYVTDRVGLAGAAVRADEAARVRRLIDHIRMAIEAGVDWIQIREKDLPARSLMDLTREAMAAAALAAATDRRTRIIVNDRLDVAVAAGAGGVHLGGESLPVREVHHWRVDARRTQPALLDFLIGASCHSIESAHAAAAGGADYIIFGPVFETPSKATFGPPQGLQKLREVCAAVQIPVIAIGGIETSNAADCFRAGASGIAAIRLFQAATDVNELRARIAATG